LELRRVLRKGLQNFEVLEWHESHPEDTCKEFRDRFAALNFLRPFLRDSQSMMHLRRIFCGSCYNGVTTRLNDHQILEQIASRLVAGQVKIVMLPAEFMAWGYVEPEPEIEPWEEPPLTTAPAEPVEEAIPPAAIAQAATLKQAAISGTPFCEP
jgi:hypothetical protein